MFRAPKSDETLVVPVTINVVIFHKCIKRRDLHLRNIRGWSIFNYKRFFLFAQFCNTSGVRSRIRSRRKMLVMHCRSRTWSSSDLGRWSERMHCWCPAPSCSHHFQEQDCPWQEQWQAVYNIMIATILVVVSCMDIAHPHAFASLFLLLGAEAVY